MGVSKAALERLDGLAERIEKAVAQGGELCTISDWGNKLVGAVCRISGVFHGLIHAKRRNPAEHEISVETILCAMAIGEYAIAQAQAAFVEMGITPAMKRARRLLGWLEQEGRVEFSARDAFNRVRREGDCMDCVKEPLRLLQDHGYIRQKHIERPGPGRKPSTLYDVNPAWHAQNAHNTHNA